MTRTAVIGKVHRLGLSNRSAPPKAVKDKPAAKEAPAKPAAKSAAREAASKKEAAATPAAEKPAATAAAPAAPARKPIIPAGQPLPPQPSNSEISEEALANVVAVEKKAKKLELMQLTEKTCKWPIGDPATDDFWFCGLAVQSGKPYCEAHTAVAFQPMSSRRDRRSR